MSKHRFYGLVGLVAGSLLMGSSWANCPNPSDISLSPQGYWITKDGWKSANPAKSAKGAPTLFFSAMATFESGSFPPDASSLFNSMACGYTTASSQNLVVLQQEDTHISEHLEGIGSNWWGSTLEMCMANDVTSCGFTSA